MGQVTAEYRWVRRSGGCPGHLYHDSFAEPSAAKRYDPRPLLDASAVFPGGYMPDDDTREHVRRMHYAAHRVHRARTAADRGRWLDRYHALRDRVVVGNLKLAFRAVRQKMAMSNYADDMVGDCQIVLLQAVAAFNPWIGIRFSTYAYTCLVRAIARTSQRLSTDWLARSVTLDALPDGEPGGPFHPEPTAGRVPLDAFLRDDHALLTDREKQVLRLRFSFDDNAVAHTLEQVGRDVGLSKERVRQVQAAAIDKLRKALTAG